LGRTSSTGVILPKQIIEETFNPKLEKDKPIKQTKNEIKVITNTEKKPKGKVIYTPPKISNFGSIPTKDESTPPIKVDKYTPPKKEEKSTPPKKEEKYENTTDDYEETDIQNISKENNEKPRLGIVVPKTNNTNVFVPGAPQSKETKKHTTFQEEPEDPLPIKSPKKEIKVTTNKPNSKKPVYTPPSMTKEKKNSPEPPVKQKSRFMSTLGSIFDKSVNAIIGEDEDDGENVKINVYKIIIFPIIMRLK